MVQAGEGQVKMLETARIPLQMEMVPNGLRNHVGATRGGQTIPLTADIFLAKSEAISESEMARRGVLSKGVKSERTGGSHRLHLIFLGNLNRRALRGGRDRFICIMNPNPGGAGAVCGDVNHHSGPAIAWVKSVNK